MVLAHLEHILPVDLGNCPGIPRVGTVGPQLAAALFLKTTLVKKVGGPDEFVVEVRTRNVGPGHAIPTGEPMRTLVLTVEAHCDGIAQPASGGDAIPGFAGAVASKSSGEDWDIWPQAQVGDVVRVVSRPGGFRDYIGPPPFGSGSFSPKDKGLLLEAVAGQSTVVSVSEGQVVFDSPLPNGDIAWLTRDDRSAGAPGFAFARVLVDATGREMVPHFLAIDVAIDNRLLPQKEAQTTHRFSVDCEKPTATATLVHRAYPPWLAAERGWTQRELVMAEARR